MNDIRMAVERCIEIHPVVGEVRGVAQGAEITRMRRQRRRVHAGALSSCGAGVTRRA